MSYKPPTAAQHKAVEYEAFYLYENNRVKFYELIRSGYFSEDNTTPFVEQLKAKVHEEVVEHEYRAEKQAKLREKHTLEITQQNQLDYKKEPVEKSHIAKAIWKSIMPTPFHTLFNY